MQLCFFCRAGRLTYFTFLEREKFRREISSSRVKPIIFLASFSEVLPLSPGARSTKQLQEVQQSF